MPLATLRVSVPLLALVPKALVQAEPVECPRAESWNFPAAVSVSADVWGLDAKGDRFDQNPDQRAELSSFPKWAETRLFNGPRSLGWSLAQYRWMGPEYTLLYEPAYNKGTLARGFALRGYDAMEPQATPLCWFRSLQLATADAGGLRREAADDKIVYSFELPREKSTISVAFRTTDLAIVHARSERTDHSGYSEWKYLEYKDLPSGHHHPSRILFEAGSKAGKVTSEIRLTSVKEVPDAEPKPAESLPQDAIIFDADRNLTLNSRMEVTELKPPTAFAGAPASSHPALGPWKTIVLSGCGLLLTCIVWGLARRWYRG